MLTQSRAASRRVGTTPGGIDAILARMAMKAQFELDAGAKAFASGLLPDLIATLRRARPGDLIALRGSEPSIGGDLELWCRFTRNSLVETSFEGGLPRWVIRCGEAPAAETERAVGSRLWLYANFDCNLRCDYCCVRSSPEAPR